MLRYEKLQIENFRCFSEITFESLDRVNLLVGKNGSGKTALLEALFIHSGLHNPELVLRVNVFRGIDVFKMDPMQPTEAPWNHLFSGFNIKVPIRIVSFNESGTQKTTLKNASINEKMNVLQKMRSVGFEVGPVSAESIQILQLESIVNEKAVQKFHLILDQYGVKVFPVPPPPPYPCVFLDARRRSSAKEIVDRFSASASNKDTLEEIISMIRTIEPRIEDLRIFTVGDTSILHTDIGIGKFIPIHYLGDGLVRTLDIALSMYNVRNGVLLIDEIEDGIHHSALEQYWTNISTLARKLNVQIFATTHSYECLVAAHRAFSKSEIYDLKVYRLERYDGQRKVVEYSKEELDASIEVGFEVR
ncbi:MAG: AAA family ATPase [Pseudothermotoga sp.]